MRALILTAAVMVVGASDAAAQIKQQVFAGAGVTAPRHAGAASTSLNGGYAVIVPLADGWSVRPLVSVARVNPTTAGRPSFSSVLAAALVIRRITPTFSLLAGGGMNTLFPASGTQRLAAAILSTNCRINDRWVMLTPLVITETGIGVNGQFAYSW